MMCRFQIVIFALFITACGSDTEKVETADEVSESFKIEFRDYSARDSSCTEEECTEIEVSIPFLSSNNRVVAEKVNEEIDAHYRRLIGARLPEPRSTGAWEDLCAGFIEGYELFTLEFPDSPESWYLYMDGKHSTILGDTLFTLKLDHSEFMGGAHGNQSVYLYSYDLKNGEPIDIAARYGESLKRVAERKFRKQHGIGPDEDLNGAGFIFPESGFILPENIGYTSKGVTLIYNPYEVASYSAGATEINIALSELDSRNAL